MLAVDIPAQLALGLSFELAEDSLEHHTTRTGLVLLGSFLLSFLFIRLSTRLMRSPKVPWWPGSITPGGLHIHHLVFGIVLLIVAGFLGILFEPESPMLELLGAAFGIGVGLTLDEFALWLHLDDVYWSEEGRRSVDAVIVAAVLGSLVVVGASPFETRDTDSIVTIAVSVTVSIAIAAVGVVKGKVLSALAGMFIAPLGIAVAIRLAKPGSPWARRRYKEGSPKLARATARHKRYDARYRRWQDLLGGAPDKPSPITGAKPGEGGE